MEHIKFCVEFTVKIYCSLGRYVIKYGKKLKKVPQKTAAGTFIGSILPRFQTNILTYTP
jgi:hypothetical protein